MEPSEQSPRGQLNAIDKKKILYGLLIAMGGAAATYISSFVASTDFGVYTPLIVAAWSTLIQIIRKYVSGPVEDIPTVN